MANTIQINIVAKDLATRELNRFVGNLQKAGSNIEGVTTRVQNAGSQLGGILSGDFLRSTAIVAAGNLIASALQRVGESFVAAAKLGIQAVSDYERLALSLESLTARELRTIDTTLDMGTALEQAGPRARELLAWVERLAVESPFTQEGVALAFRTSLAYGFTTKQAQRLTQATLDFTAATGASSSAMDRISLALGQIQAKGKLAGQEILQLVNAGIPVNQILAKAFGVTTQELTVMREKGLIPAGKAIEAIVSSLEQDFAGAAKRQATSLAGIFSSLQDIRDIGLRELFRGAAEAMQPFLQRLVEVGSSVEFLDQVRTIGASIGAGMATGLDALQSLLDLLSRVKTGFDDLKDIEGVSATFISMRQSAGEATDKMPALNAEIERLKGNLEGLEPAGQGLARIAGFLGNLVSRLFGSLDDIAVAALERVNRNIESTQTILTAFGTGLRAYLQGDFSEAWAQAGEVVAGFKDKFLGEIESLQTGAGILLDALAGATVTTFTQMGVDVEGIWVDVVNVIIDNINEAIGQVNALISSLNAIRLPADPLSNQLSRLLGARPGGAVIDIPLIKPITAQEKQRLIQPVHDLVEEAELAIKLAGHRGTNSFIDDMDRLRRNGTRAMQQIGSEGTDAFDAIGASAAEAGKEAEKIADKLNQIFTGAISNVRGAVQAALSDLGTSVTEEDFILEAAGLRLEAVGESIRRLNDVIQRATHPEQFNFEPSPWIDAFEELRGLAGTELAATAIQLKRDIEDFLRPDLLNLDAILEQARRTLIGQANKEALIEQLTNALIGEGFGAFEIQRALAAQFGDAAGLSAAEMGQAFGLAIEDLAPTVTTAVQGKIVPAFDAATGAGLLTAEMLRQDLQSSMTTLTDSALTPMVTTFLEWYDALVGVNEELDTLAGNLQSGVFPPPTPVPSDSAQPGTLPVDERARGGYVYRDLALVGERGMELARLPGPTIAGDTVRPRESGGTVGNVAQAHRRDPSRMRLLGTRGPELVKLPRGTRVFTHTQTRTMLEHAGRRSQQRKALTEVVPTGRAQGGVVKEELTLIGEKGPELVQLPDTRMRAPASQTTPAAVSLSPQIASRVADGALQIVPRQTGGVVGMDVRQPVHASGGHSSESVTINMGDVSVDARGSTMNKGDIKRLVDQALVAQEERLAVRYARLRMKRVR